ncbi:MAG: hypothetical protein Q7S06_00050 [Nanoarchaeota archaeon]|nr:hypothetical protein [Nanoarchaeota archaeon]
MELQTKGLELLSEKEQQIADKLIKEYYEKIKRQIKKDFKFRIHFKEYDKEGEKKKYSINAEVLASKKFSASDYDWDFARALHKVMIKLVNQIEHAFHSSEQK